MEDAIRGSPHVRRNHIVLSISFPERKINIHELVHLGYNQSYEKKSFKGTVISCQPAKPSFYAFPPPCSWTHAPSVPSTLGLPSPCSWPHIPFLPSRRYHPYICHHWLPRTPKLSTLPPHSSLLPSDPFIPLSPNPTLSLVSFYVHVPLPPRHLKMKWFIWSYVPYSARIRKERGRHIEPRTCNDACIRRQNKIHPKQSFRYDSLKTERGKRGEKSLNGQMMLKTNLPYHRTQILNFNF